MLVHRIPPFSTLLRRVSVARPGGAGRRPAAARAGDTATDALLVAAGYGDVDSFAAFYDRTAPATVALLERVLGRRPDLVEHTAREVYLAVWRRAPRFDPARQSAQALLLRTVRGALVAPVLNLLGTDRPAPPDGA